jgi:hypothetical protein
MSKNTLTLDNPIIINGKEVKELTYDAQEITAEQFSIACIKSASLDKSRAMTLKAKENDYSLHLYLGMMAVIAVNPDIDVSDLERIKGFDVLDLTNIGTFFIVRKSAAPSVEGNSGEQSENTPATSTQASEKSSE